MKEIWVFKRKRAKFEKTHVYQSMASFVVPPKPQVPPILIVGLFDLIFPPLRYFTKTSSNSRTVWLWYSIKSGSFFRIITLHYHLCTIILEQL
jgi:hypothetical protein